MFPLSAYSNMNFKKTLYPGRNDPSDPNPQTMKCLHFEFYMQKMRNKNLKIYVELIWSF